MRIETIDKIIKNAISPFRRVRLILIFFSILIFIVQCIYWNCTNEGFISLKKEYLIDYGIKPPPKEGGFWRTYNGLFGGAGWAFYDFKCLEDWEKKSAGQNKVNDFEACAKERRPGIESEETRLRQSFGGFMGNLFSRGPGGYFDSTFAACIFLILKVKTN